MDETVKGAMLMPELVKRIQMTLLSGKAGVRAGERGDEGDRECFTKTRVKKKGNQVECFSKKKTKIRWSTCVLGRVETREMEGRRARFSCAH